MYHAMAHDINFFRVSDYADSFVREQLRCFLQTRSMIGDVNGFFSRLLMAIQKCFVMNNRPFLSDTIDQSGTDHLGCRHLNKLIFDGTASGVDNKNVHSDSSDKITGPEWR